jgi:hypothetical protein
MEEKKEENNIQLFYKPNEKKVSVINYAYNRFTKMREERDKERDEYDGRTLAEYVKDNVYAYNGIVPREIKNTKEAWQSLIFDNKTRGKVKATVALVASARPFISLIGKTFKDHKNASDIRLVFEDSHRVEKGNYELYKEIFSACVKGTVIVEEGYQEITKEEKTITSINHETGKITFKKNRVIEGGAGRVFASIVPILSFYWNEHSAEIRHDCVRMVYLGKEDFNRIYGNYEESKYVHPGIVYDNIEECDYKCIAEDQSDVIEILKYYNEDSDEFILLANGVWLNPQENDEICPLPFAHKKLPFTRAVFELADEESQYGKALPDIMSGEQETINALLRMTVDQEILSIHKPILLGQGAELESYQLFPGKTFRTAGDITQIRELDISGTQNSTFQTLEWLDKKSDVNTAIDANAMGVHSGKKTAKEATLLDEGSKRLAGTFQTFIYNLLLNRAELRISNICQFYKNPVQYSAIKDKYGKKVGERKEYRQIAVTEQGKEPFWIEVTPDKCNSKFDIRLEEDIEPTMSRQERLSAAVALLEEAKNNPLLSADEATLEFIISLGKNPDRFYIKPTMNDMRASINGQLPPQDSTGGNLINKQPQ